MTWLSKFVLYFDFLFPVLLALSVEKYCGPHCTDVVLYNWLLYGPFTVMIMKYSRETYYMFFAGIDFGIAFMFN